MTKTYLKFRTRITVLTCFIILSWSTLCARLFQIQVLNREKYQKIILNQARKKQTLIASRGNIYDRNNRPFTRNIIHYTLSANPQVVKDKSNLAEILSRNTGKPVEKYLNKLKSKDNFVYLERNLQKETLGALENISIDGLHIKRHYRRYYPHNSIAAQIIGYTNVDDMGISGIEKDFNEYLTGTPGWVIKTKGWKGKFQKKSGNPYQEPINGNNIQLTIDLEYQSVLEEELYRRQQETNAKAATGIIMNPQTGEIIAMASTPGFNNNRYFDTEMDYHRVRAVTDQFEPGSTFKIVAAISALSKNAVNLTDEFNCENGKFPYYDITITDHEKFGFLTLPQIIQNSSNIGVVKVMEKVGSISLFETARNLGFGTITRISISGELSGKLHPVKNWSRVSQGQISMGYEVGVTAMQLATAYCAVANGGFMVSPRIVRQIIKNNKDVVYTEEPSIIRRVANKDVMNQVNKMLRSVVLNGTGHNAEIAGWEVAGKTGTAKKVLNGKYSDDKYISNFIGIFPYQNPQLLGLIVLDEPDKPYHWGSEGAAIAFKRVMKRIINLDDNIVPPSKLKKEQAMAIRNPGSSNITFSDIKSSELSLKIHPPLLSNVSLYDSKIKMPDVRGYSMRKAMTTLRDHGIKFKIEGSGQVLWQSPRPGTILNNKNSCVIHLK
ncbi:MAG: hypothetical protein CMG74_02870 [Candidatus Marinimicrobia bacterium]|nr:hypothetical protein [Candidatus Neomarinimicrobiota bacterium]|tara:strand:+ start:11559 stop:13553 length:1995 start_codon:yes stop_codon:yes gene_type:complete